MRRTKIVCTIGPASISYNVMKKLAQAGMNVVRINLSHAVLDDMNTIMDNVKRIKAELGIPLTTMIDTRGPELRVKKFKDGSVNIKKGQEFIFTSKSVVGTNEIVSVNIPSVIKELKVGDKILAVNGLLVFRVIEVRANEVVTKAMTSGVIANRKSLSIPGVKLTGPYLNTHDKKDILWAIENKVDLIAASFVNSKDDVETLRSFIKKNGGDLKIISKIESKRGVKNLDEIVKASDGIMVARGDLGVEIPISQVPEVQKELITKSVKNYKQVITATEMLESMITNKRPTRAEVSDIFNAVYDGTSCVMLSGETAMGQYPVEAVRTMAEVCERAEKAIMSNKHAEEPMRDVKELDNVLLGGAVLASRNELVKAIVCFSASGKSGNIISSLRPDDPIIVATPSERVYGVMGYAWGVKPVMTSTFKTTDKMFDVASKIAKDTKLVKEGDYIVVTSGTPSLVGGTNLIKVIQVK